MGTTTRPRRFEPRRQRGFFAEVTTEIDDAHATVALLTGQQALEGAVGTAVVDKHRLDPHRRVAVEHLAQMFEKQSDRFFLVQDRDDQRDVQNGAARQVPTWLAGLQQACSAHRAKTSCPWRWSVRTPRVSSEKRWTKTPYTQTHGKTF